MKKIIIFAVLLCAAPSFAATWEIKITKDGAEQSARVITADEIKDIQIASARTGKDVYNYFWEAMNDMFRGIEDQNVAKQVETELTDIKTRMRQ